MGRVAKYKSIKAVDPFAKAGKKKELEDANRGRGAAGRKSKRKKEGWDLPGGEDDFKLDENGNIVEDYVAKKNAKRAKKEREEAALLPVKKDAFDVAHSEMGGYKMDSLAKKIDYKSQGGNPFFKQVKMDEKTAKGTFQAKNEDESMRAFNRRIKNETREVLRDDVKSQQTNDRRKEYLKEKKKKKKGGGHFGGKSGEGEYFGNEGTHGGAVGGRRRAGSDSDEGEDDDYVHFGEQADRPPEFKVTPKSRKKVVEEEEDSSNEDEDERGESEVLVPRLTYEIKGKKVNDVKENSRSMEMLRARVQDSYKALKKRRKEGDVGGKNKGGFIGNMNL